MPKNQKIPGIGGKGARPRPGPNKGAADTAEGSGSGPSRYDGRANMQAGSGIDPAQHTLDVSKPPKFLRVYGGNTG